MPHQAGFLVEPVPRAREGARLDERPEDGAQQLRRAVQPAARPGHVPGQAGRERDRRVEVPARHVGGRVDCAAGRALRSCLEEARGHAQCAEPDSESCVVNGSEGR